MSALVVVSHYNAWPTDHLVALLDQMEAIPSGMPFDVCIVVNRATPAPLILPERHNRKAVLYRENTGYNIGAWDYGWRQNFEYRWYLFLQEECRILRTGWLLPFRRLISKPDIGLVGESLHWAGLTWDKLARKYRHFPFVALVEGESVPIPVGIRAGLRRLGVADGRTGAHLQSVTLCARREVLEAINGFDIGLNYAEATIAEVAISKKVESLGLKVRETGFGSFRYILHPQWRRRQGVIRWLARTVISRLPTSM